MASFCTVLWAKEEKPVLDRVVDFYLDQGASRVAVFFDEDPDFDMDTRGGRLEFVAANEAFWRDLEGGRPDSHEKRQDTIYRHTISERSEDWILFLDCDEFLVSQRPIAEALDQVPEDVDIVRVQNVEAIWGPGDDRNAPLGARWFRRPAKSRWKNLCLRLVYPGLRKVMKDGLVGHSEGKHFVRSRRSYARTCAHWSTYADGRPGEWAHDLLEDEMFVCHYDAMSFDLWRKKFLYRLEVRSSFVRMRGKRERMVDLFASAAKGGEPKMRALFERLFCVSGVRLKLLQALGLAFRRDIFSSRS